MKFTSALVIAALLGATMVVEETQAVKLTDSDDLIKSLAEDMQKENESQEAAPEAAPEEKPAEKAEKKEAPKKEAKKADKKDKKDKKKDSKKPADKKKDAKKPEKKKEEQDDIPMDAAAIKAYSSVIADAAVDSEPSVPVQYHEVITDDDKKKEAPLTVDPMASMIQNEISEIKDASIKAAADKE